MVTIQKLYNTSMLSYPPYQCITTFGLHIPVFPITVDDILIFFVLRDENFTMTLKMIRHHWYTARSWQTYRFYDSESATADLDSRASDSAGTSRAGEAGAG